MTEEEEEDARGGLSLAGAITVCEEMLRTVKGTLPEEFWQHERAARRETLLAFRVLLDAAITRLEQEPDAGRAAPRAGRIEIE
jgi:hypothetical protein